jgi:hypothetical protein
MCRRLDHRRSYLRDQSEKFMALDGARVTPFRLTCRSRCLIQIAPLKLIPTRAITDGKIGLSDGGAEGNGWRARRGASGLSPGVLRGLMGHAVAAMYCCGNWTCRWDTSITAGLESCWNMF